MYLCVHTVYLLIYIVYIGTAFGGTYVRTPNDWDTPMI